MPFDYSIKDLDQIDSPALLLYPELVRANIEEALRMIGNVERLRPHVKTNKSADAIRLMLDAGIRKFKCATIAEAELLGMCGAPDVLLAYQPVGPKLARFLAVLEKCPATQFSCLTDHRTGAEQMAAVFSSHEKTVPLFVDLNIGQNRTGITPEAAFALYQACSEMKGVRPVGLHAYDGHIRHSDWEARRKACDAAFLPVQALADRLTRAGHAAPIIVAGGSPTYSVHVLREQVECSPGTFIYWDKGYADLCPEQAFQPAALLLTRVVSLPAPNIICLDLGHKSVAAENPIDQRVFFPDAPDLKPLGQSEEHLVMQGSPGHSYHLGDALLAVPVHICPTVALFERAIPIENQRISGEWVTGARNRKITC